jgi:deaminated glutathione amidase
MGAQPTIFKAACVQMTSGRDVLPNLDIAADLIRQAAQAGAKLVMTPENTSIIEPNKPLAVQKAVAEADHPGLPFFADLARELGIWLLIGSMPIKLKDGKLANRSFLFGPDGRIQARYDKIHMFDVDLPNGETYRESATAEAGNAAVIAETPWGKLGLTVCYDLRFAYLHRALAQAGAAFLSVPSAFTVPTGEAHWHVLLRARAIETGCFVFAPAQCGTHAEGRKTYGHSLIVAPWGEVLADAGSAPGIILAEIDTARIQAARGMVPALRHDKTFTPPTHLAAAAG